MTALLPNQTIQATAEMASKPAKCALCKGNREVAISFTSQSRHSYDGTRLIFYEPAQARQRPAHCHHVID
jgi:hypothetical protein